MPWTTEQKIFIAEAYFRQKSIHEAQLQFKERFGCREFPVHEAHFLLSGHVNSKNNIFWRSTPPEHCLQRPIHSVKCTAWVAISKYGIIGPFWCEDHNERFVAINTERYVQAFSKFWTALGPRRGVVRVLQLFQQDGPTRPLLKRIIGIATAAFSWPTDQLQVWPAMVAAFTRLEPPRFLP